ncbi:acyltransferase [Methylobacillus flagellatus]|uniref:acyltransferase family protein n=1 Tax=Methylobacillus flagellatus TaxID=405 RepID=UPI0028540E88|nr:acyltransferase [Methylobacillus flagellatus]MDR5172633.1 acyltransferase [Methylobacillus flagellatus]
MVDKEKIIALDGLRGWMAVWVWVTHVVTMATLPLVKTSGLGMVLANGQYAVGVFILLSGFVISNTATRSSWSKFILRRFFRLFPAYLICLLLSVLILDISIQFLTNAPWPMERAADRVKYLTDSKDYFWPHLSLHVLLLHGLVPDSILPSTSYAFMGQAWSLTLEWQYYLIAVLFLKLISMTRNNILLECLAILTLALISLKLNQSSFIASNLWLFLIGHLFWKHFDDRQTWRYPLWILAALPAGLKVLSILIFMVVILACFKNWRINRFLETGVSRFLGRVSYGFYCIHMVSIFTIAYTLLFVFNITDRVIFASALIALSLVMSLLIAWILNILVENPMIALGRKLTSSKPKLAKAV